MKITSVLPVQVRSKVSCSAVAAIGRPLVGTKIVRSVILPPRQVSGKSTWLDSVKQDPRSSRDVVLPDSHSVCRASTVAVLRDSSGDGVLGVVQSGVRLEARES